MRTLLLVLLLGLAGWAEPTLKVVASTSRGIVFEFARRNTSGKPMEAWGSGTGGRLEISRDGTVVDSVVVHGMEDGARRVVKPGEVISSTRFLWKGGPPGRYVACVEGGPQLAFQLPMTKDGMKAKSAMLTGRLLLDTASGGFSIVYEARNLTKEPLTVVGSSVGGALVIMRGKVPVATLMQGRSASVGGRRVVAPGAVGEQASFAWPGAGKAAPGEYTARFAGLELKFKLPRK